jgi:hypothetical protein
VIAAGTTVELNGASRTVGRVTVQAGGTLQTGTVYATLTVTGALVNGGTLRDNPGGWTLTLRAGGNVTSTGTWGPVETKLIGATAQTLSLGAGTTFTGTWSDDDGGTNSDVVAASDLAFTGSVDLKGSDLQMGGYRLDLSNGSVFQSNADDDGTASFTAGGRLRMRQNAFVQSLRLSGPVTFEGQSRVATDVAVVGDVTVAPGDSLLPATVYTPLPIAGSVTNHGHVSNHEGGWLLTLYVSGHVVNNGVWDVAATHLNGQSAQTLTLGSGAVFNSPFHDDDALSPLVAGSDLRFSQSLYLYGATLQMGSRRLTMDAATNLAVLYGDDGGGNGPAGTVDFDSGRLHLVNPTGHAYVQRVTVGGPVELDGDVHVSNDVTFDGAVTVRTTGVLQSTTAYVTANVIGGLTNLGTVRDHAGGWELTLRITGNVTHAGAEWSAHETVVAGTGAQAVGLGSIQTFGRTDGGITYFTVGVAGQAPTAWRTAGSNLRFRDVVVRMDGDEHFDLGGRRLELDGGYLDGLDGVAGGIVNGAGGTVKLTDDAYVQNVHLAGPVTLDGTVVLSTGVQMSSGFTLASTGVLMNTSAYITQAIGGNLTVYGQVQQYPGGWHLTLNVAGDLTFAGGSIDAQQLSVGGQLVVPALAGGPTLTLGDTELLVHGLDVDGLTIRNGWVRAVGVVLDKFDHVNYANPSGSQVYRQYPQLRIDHPGLAGEFTVHDVSFLPLADYFFINGTHDAGYYGYAVDTTPFDGVRHVVMIVGSDRQGGDTQWRYVMSYDPQTGTPFYGFTQFDGGEYGGEVNWPLISAGSVAPGTSATYTVGTPGQPGHVQLTGASSTSQGVTVHQMPGRRCNCTNATPAGAALGFTEEGFLERPIPDTSMVFDGAIRIYAAGEASARAGGAMAGADQLGPLDWLINFVRWCLSLGRVPPAQPWLRPAVGVRLPNGSCRNLGRGSVVTLPNGGMIVAVGGGNFVDVSSGRIVAVGGGNIIANGGGNLVPGRSAEATIADEIEGLLEENEWVELFVGYVEETVVDARVVLEGAHDPAHVPADSTSLPMRADLLAAGTLPSVQPYADAVFAGSPMAYDADVTLPAGFLAAHPEVVDWVIVELRTGTGASSLVGYRAGLLLRDGRITEFDAVNPIGFQGITGTSFYVVVRHRNHLPLMSATAVDFSAGTGVIDFTQPGAAFGTDPAVEVQPGLFALASGDLDVDGDVDAADETAWRGANGTAGYLQADPGFDGAATAADLQERVRPGARRAGPPRDDRRYAGPARLSGPRPDGAGTTCGRHRGRPQVCREARAGGP